MQEYDKLILRIEPYAGPERYEVFAEGAGYEAHGRFDLPFDANALENFILRMSHRRRAARRVETSDAARARQFGGQLFDALFQGDVRDLYHDARGQARRRGRGLRVTLALTKTPELTDVPWEFLYDAPDFLSVSAWTPVVRYLDLARPRDTLPVEPPLRILGMISDAVDLAPLDVDGERAHLEEAVRGLARRGLVEVQWTREATLAALLRKLRTGEFHVFHFIGHGAYDEERQDGILLLEGDQGRSVEVSGDRLGTILCDHATLRLAVLNACEGARSSRTDPFAGVAASLVQHGLPAVVAMQFEITDTAAVTFAAHFYEALARGYPVDAALGSARQGLVAAGNDVEWGTPVLFMRPSDGRIFDLRERRPLSQHAQLDVTLEAQPAFAKVGEPVTYTLYVENVGRPSLTRVTPRALDEQPLGDPVDLMPGECETFTWSSPAEPGGQPHVVVTAKPPSGPPLRVVTTPGIAVARPAAAMVLELDASQARVARGDQIRWRLRVRNTGGAALLGVVAEDEQGQVLTGRVDVPPGEERELTWDATAERSGELRATVRARDPEGRMLSATATGAVEVLPLPEPRTQPRTRGRVRRAAAAVATLTLFAIGAVVATRGGGDEGNGGAGPPDTRPREPRPRREGDTSARARLTVPLDRYGSLPSGIAVAEGRVWVISPKLDRVALIDETRPGRPRWGPRVGGDPREMVSGGGLVWISVGRPRPGVVSFMPGPVDRSPGELPRANPIAIAHAGNFLWVAHKAPGRGDELLKLQRGGTTLAGPRVRIDAELGDVAASSKAVWLVTATTNEVVRVDRASGDPSTPVRVGRGPHAIAFGAGAAWVVNRADDTVTRVDAQTLNPSEIPVGKRPRNVVVRGRDVWVVNGGDNTLTRIDAHLKKRVQKAIRVGSNPKGLAVTDEHVWVTNQGDNTVTRVPIKDVRR